MVSRLRWLMLAGIMSFAGLLGYWYARYLLDTSQPEISIVGIENNSSYAGDITCIITGGDNYKVGDISIWLDDKLLVQHYKIHVKKFDYSSPHETKAFPKGRHTQKMLFEDAPASRNSTIK